MKGRNDALHEWKEIGSENSSTFLLRLVLASILDVKEDQREEGLVS